MATQASQLPAGLDTTLYDLGRIAALWVSAFEILTHPRKGKAGLGSAYACLSAVSHLDRKVKQRHGAPYLVGSMANCIRLAATSFMASRSELGL